MNTFTKLYFQLTKYIPRTLPQTEEEIKNLTRVMVEAYGVEDSIETQYTLLSQVVAGKPTSLRRSYGLMANACNKLKVAKLAGERKQKLAQDHYEAMMKEAELKKNDTEMREGSHDLQADVPSLPISQEGLVQLP